MLEDLSIIGDNLLVPIAQSGSDNMQSRIWKARPRLKTVIIALVLGLLFGFMAKGNDPQLFLGVVMAVLVLGLIWIRNYDPDTFEAHSDPIAYHRRKAAEELFGALRDLTEAAESNDQSKLEPARIKARDVVNKFEGQKI